MIDAIILFSFLLIIRDHLCRKVSVHHRMKSVSLGSDRLNRIEDHLEQHYWLVINENESMSLFDLRTQKKVI